MNELILISFIFSGFANRFAVICCEVCLVIIRYPLKPLNAPVDHLSYEYLHRWCGRGIVLYSEGPSERHR
jgi:hypothetical protein